jgi:chromate transporter
MNQKSFLKDVFICSLGAYGGPEAHYSVFTDQLVLRKGYLSEEELIELIALCGILPGPSSTQTIVAIGYKLGGPKLGLLAMLVWALPVLTVMTFLSFLYQLLSYYNMPEDWLRYVSPMAVGFILVAAWRIGRKVIIDKLTAGLMIMAALATYFVREPWIFPLVLLSGGAITVFVARQKDLWNRVPLHPPWKYLVVFFFLAITGIILTITWDHLLVHLYESFYRYGYLVFGGGQIVVPVMHSELVEVRGYMTNEEFLTGYGLVQGLPGPMFSFAAYAGGMAARGSTFWVQLAGAMLGGMGIFLPGMLLIYFIYPVWENMKKIKGIRISLKGINAVAGGLIAIAAVILLEKTPWTADNLVIILLTGVLLLTRKVPAPLIVGLVLAAGFVI